MICPACSTENPPGAKFCLECGTPLTQALPATREERKVVSVLFCDLVGFTSRAERLDPEDVRAVLGPYHARVRAVLERHGGTVEKFVGDAVMSVFGAPQAHEDDPERAVRAALAIRDRIAEANEEEGSPELHVRIGITTGEALVNLGARPELGEGMAAGDVVNTAARLQAAAPVDGVLVDAVTFRATDRAIEYQEAEAVVAKGKAEVVPAWEALQARAALGVDVRQQVRTPLVGRVRELDTLIGAFTRARHERVPQLVTLVGVPGIGKSRLVWELLRHAEELSELVRWRQGRSLPYGEGISLWALSEMVKAEAGVLETDDAETAVEKLGRSVRDLAEDEGQATWVLRRLRPLLGLGDEEAADGERRQEAFAAWRRYLEALAEDSPTVLVFEDLHWADEELLAFVDHLIDWAEDVPLLVVGTARPELLASRPDWGGGKPNAVTLSLSPLSDEETAQLLHELFQRSAVPANVQQALLERAGGNPLYAEEFVRAAGGRSAADLPESIQGLIAARLDALPPAEKELLQDAAVVGKVFWLGTLSRLGDRGRAEAEALLHALVRKEFVRRERRSSVAGEDEYAFRHALVRDGAYAQIPRARRAETHRLAAEWIGELARAEDHAELLAHHRTAALEYARAAGLETSALEAAARSALREAGERARSLNAFAAAAGFYSRAVELSPPDDDGRGELLLRRGEALAALGDSEAATAVLEAAAAALVTAGRNGQAAEAHALLSSVAWYGGDAEASTSHLGKARALVQEEAPSAAKAAVLAKVAGSLMVADDAEGAVAVGREALALAEVEGLDALRAELLATIGSARTHLDDRGGLEDLEASVELSEQAGAPGLPRMLLNLSVALLFDGELGKARDLRARAIRAAERLGAGNMLRFALGADVGAAMVEGDWRGGLDRADAFVDECLSAPHYQETTVRMTRATLRLAVGDEAGALEDARRAVELASEAGDLQVRVPALSVLAYVASELGRREEAHRAFDEALALAVEADQAWRHLFYAVWAALALGREAGLAPHFRERWQFGERWVAPARAALGGDLVTAVALFEEIGAAGAAALTRLKAAAELVAAGRRAEADEQLTPALAYFRSQGAIRYVRESEALLAPAG